MDAFGRLPNDVISQITSLYNTPKIEFIDEGDQQIYLIINAVPYNCKFYILSPLCRIDGVNQCESNALQKLKHLIDNKHGSYLEQIEKELFCVDIDNIITIHTENVTLTMPNNNIDAVICGLKQYYDLLDKYPKY